MRSMRAKLLLILLLTTGAVWLSAAAWIYFSTQAHVEQVLDARLREAARMVDSLLTDERVEVASAANAVGDFKQNRNADAYSRQLSCQIWSLSGSLVGRSQSAPQQRLAGGGDGFSQTVIDGETWRVYTVRNPERGVQVMVGDNLQIRQSLVNDVMTGTLLPMALILPIGALLIWLSVRQGLTPLDRMAHALSERHANDLRPLGFSEVPAELHPVLRAVNELFGRVEAAREREKSFTAFAAHELKTPLAGLKTQAQIALASDEPQTRTHALAQITSGVDRSARLVRQLLDLAAADASDEGNSATAAVSQVVEDALLAVDALGCRLSVTIRVEGVCAGHIACDQGLATTALRNVLENALLHSPAGGEVLLSVTDGDTKSRLVIEDGGPGMSEAELTHAGERFFRGQSQAPSGTGLGLAIVETVLKRAGGSAAFTNRDGGGLRVELFFPLA